MQVWGLSLEELEAAARAVGLRFEGVERGVRVIVVRGRVFPERGEARLYGKVSLHALPYGGRERKVNAVCWHGHREFMREVFRRNAGARVKTVLADYRGADDFERKYRGTAGVNIGSMMYPVYADEACNCALEGLDVERLPDYAEVA